MYSADSTTEALRQRLGKTGNSVYDDGIRKWLAMNVQDWFQTPEAFTAMVAPDSYVRAVLDWLRRSANNQILGLDTFTEAVPCLGVTQALDEFHYRILREGRTLRLFRGEYPYNRDVHAFHSSNYLDDRPLQSGDAVILSCPFSGSGDPHPRHEEVLDQALRLEVPVLIDAAWIGTCTGIRLDLSHPAISQAAFSLTKGLSCGNYRSGIRLSRGLQGADRLVLQNEWKHGIHLNTFIGMKLTQQFGPDRQVELFRKAQLAVCDRLGLVPSSCVHIARGQGPEWDGYTRDGAFNRVNLREAIKWYLANS